VAFFAMQHYVLFAGDDLLDERIDAQARRRIAYRNRVGLVPYAVALALAPLSSYATLALCGAVAVFYALPTTTAE
jgi:hypothetical protein